LSPATKFVAADGTVSRPFNNFLQQATLLSTEGTMTMESSDLSFKPGAPKTFDVDAGGNMTIKFTITNIGGTPFTGPIDVQMFTLTLPDTYTPFSASPTYTIPNAAGLNPGSDIRVTFTVPSAQVPATYDGLGVTINLTSGMGTPAVFAGSTECRSLNNRALGFNALSGMAVLCQGTSGTVSVDQTGKYDVFWFDGSGAPLTTVESDTYAFGPKDSSPVTHLLVQAKYKGTSTWVSAVMDTVYVYRAADTLVWNNSKANGDWNDYENWTNPNDPANTYSYAKVPMPCTNVLLPGTTANYPDLGSSTTLPYGPLGTTVANRVHFDFGSELKRPDLLSYDSAFVKMRLAAHRWYMIAPPLKQTYPGDFYLKNPVPVLDDMKAYTRFWNMAAPNGTFVESNWSSLFYEPGHQFQKGQGMGVWLSSNDDVQRNYELSFPKFDAVYNVYYENTTTINPYLPPAPTVKTQAYRFIFDGEGGNGADFELNAVAATGTSLVMVGNPFMSHLDFDAFYAKNSTKIQNRYRVMDSSGSFKYYRIGGPSDGGMTKNIAPMQAIIVEAITPFTTLTVNPLMTLSVPGAGNTLKSAAAEDSPAVYIRISARQGERSSQAHIELSETAVSAYNTREDIAGLYETAGVGKEALEVYSVSSDGLKLALNSLPSSYAGEGGIIPLGIRTSSKERLTLNVSNLPALQAGGNRVYLYDASTQTDYDLSRQSMYTFDAPETDDNRFADNRFYLKIVKSGEGVQPEATDNTVSVVYRHGLLTVQSLHAIEELSVYDLQGRLVHHSQPQGVSQQLPLAGNRLYVVKVKSGGRTTVRKVMN
jgi:hypothetical protein